jgi:hypothetical protein
MYGRARSWKGAGRVKKLLGWMLLALVVFYIGTSPGPAAEVARSIGDVLGEMFRNVGTFLRELAT